MGTIAREILREVGRRKKRFVDQKKKSVSVYFWGDNKNRKERHISIEKNVSFGRFPRDPLNCHCKLVFLDFGLIRAVFCIFAMVINIEASYLSSRR